MGIRFQEHIHDWKKKRDGKIICNHDDLSGMMKHSRHSRKFPGSSRSCAASISQPWFWWSLLKIFLLIWYYATLIGQIRILDQLKHDPFSFACETIQHVTDKSQPYWFLPCRSHHSWACISAQPRARIPKLARARISISRLPSTGTVGKARKKNWQTQN